MTQDSYLDRQLDDLTMKSKPFTFLVACFFCLNAQILFSQTDTIKSFKDVREIYLTRAKKTKHFLGADLVFYTQEFRNDTVVKEVEINAPYDAFYRNDTLILNPSQVIEDFYGHKDFYTITTNYRYKTPIQIHLPVQSITKVKKERSLLKGVTGTLMFLSGFSALMVAPAVSLGKNFNENRYYSVAGYSLLTFGAALTINLSFGKKIYPIHSKNPKRKIWKISGD